MMKICSRCKIEKPLGAFYGRGLKNYCRPCDRQYGREWYRRRAEYARERARNSRGGYRGNQAHLEADNDRKHLARLVLEGGGTIEQAIECLKLARVQSAILERIIADGGTASLDDILSFVYGDEPDPGDRPRQYNTLKRQIFTVRKRLLGTGIILRNCGYGKGYSLVRGDEQ